MNSLLSIESLELSFELYKRNLKVLNKINLNLFKGEKIAVVGESGSGKSVMLRIILGILNNKNAFIQGKVFFDSVDLRTQKENYMKSYIRGREKYQ